MLIHIARIGIYLYILIKSHLIVNLLIRGSIPGQIRRIVLHVQILIIMRLTVEIVFRPQIGCRPVTLVIGDIVADAFFVQAIVHILTHDQFTGRRDQIARLRIVCRITVCSCRIIFQHRLVSICRRCFAVLCTDGDGCGQSIPVQILIRYHFIQSVICQTVPVICRGIDILLHQAHTIVICFRDIVQIRGIYRRHLVQVAKLKCLGDLVLLVHRFAKSQGSIRTVSGKDITSGIIRIAGLIGLVTQSAQAVDDLLTVGCLQGIRCAALTLSDHALHHRYRRADRGLGQLQPGLCIRDILFIELLDLGQVGAQTQRSDCYDRIFGRLLDLLTGRQLGV